MIFIEKLKIKILFLTIIHGIQIYMLIFIYFQIAMGSILSMHLLQVVQVMEEFILFIMIKLGMLLKINHLEKVIF